MKRINLQISFEFFHFSQWMLEVYFFKKFILQIVSEIYITNLSVMATEVDLMNIFSVYGNLLVAKILLEPNGVNTGTAVIGFDNVLVSQQVVGSFEGFMIYEKPIHLELLTGKSPVVYISNLKKTWNCKTVQDLMTNAFPTVIKVNVLDDPKGQGRNRGYCFVTFDTLANAQNAMYTINSEGYKIGGQKLIANWADTQSDFEDEESLNVYISICL